MVEHPHSSKLKVEIVQGSEFDQQLDEYHEADEVILTESDPGSRFVVRYVEATPGAPFSVRFNIPGHYDGIFIYTDLQIDGKHVRSDKIRTPLPRERKG
jgi:hypothetical protein